MDVILEYRGISGFQSQQVLVPRFDRLQLVLRVLGLPLMEEEERFTIHERLDKHNNNNSTSLSNTAIEFSNEMIIYLC